MNKIIGGFEVGVVIDGRLTSKKHPTQITRTSIFEHLIGIFCNLSNNY
ncbi:hypothetical protein [Pseudomonas aeruginosa]|nr:hypothetical protein [Pseudomonas aeruginosa]UFK74847.1 hypothetical protein K0E51_12240 [Pseudomonas aeruginosa SG17M]WCW39178.1 hypothetical protein KK209_11205 [Pseudomonas aeruginosa]